MHCYHCHKNLERYQFRKQSVWKCPKCLGALFSIATLRSFPEAKSIIPQLRPEKDRLFSSRLCSACKDVMRIVTLQDRHFMRLEVCDDCRLVWFEKEEYQLSEIGPSKFGERQTVPSKIIPPLKKKSPERSKQGIVDISLEDPDINGFVNEIFHLPQIENSYQSRVEALIIPFLVMLCFIFSFSSRNGAEMLGFNTALPWRLEGLTWISAIFVQVGLFHLVSNGYFIYLFGRNLEDLLGPIRFLSLFLLGGIGGHLAFYLFAPPGQIAVGASGSVMALMTYYACTFPRTRLVFFRTFSFLPYAASLTQLKAKFNVWLVLLFYLLLDFVGSKDQMENLSTVSHLSHLGGAAVGFLIWIAEGESV